MPETKITVNATDLASDVFAKVNAALQANKQAADDAGQAHENAGPKVAGLQKYLEDIVPSTDHAHASFTDLKTTITDMWANPTQGISHLASALSQELGPSLGGLGIAAGAAGGAMAGLGVIAYELTSKVAAVGSEIERGSIISGISAEKFSELKFAVEATGGSTDQLTNAAFMLEKRLGDAGATGDKTRAAIDALGLSSEDFANLPVDQQLLKLSEGFRGLGEDVNKQALAFDLLGRQGRDMLPTLMQPMQELADKAKALGIAWSEDDVKAAHALEVESNVLTLELGKISTHIGQVLLPVALDAAKALEHLFSFGASSTMPTGAFVDPKQQDLLVKYGEALQHDGDTAWTMAQNIDGLSVSIHANAGEIEASLKKHSDALDKAAEDQEKFNVKVDAAKQSITGDAEATRVQVAALDSLTHSTSLTWNEQEALNQKINDLMAKSVPLTDAIYAWETAHGHLVNVTDLVNTSLGYTNTIVPDLRQHMWDMGEALGDINGRTGMLLSTTMEMNGTFSDTGAVVGGGLVPMFTDSLPQGLRTTSDEADHLAASIASARDQLKQIRDEQMNPPAEGPGPFSGLIDQLENGIPQALTRAFEGGGNLSGALKSIESRIGNELGTGISKEISKSITDSGGDVSGVLTSTFLKALPVVGAAIGPLISALFSIGGPSQEELQGRQTEAAFEQQMGGWQGIQKALVDTGMAADQANAMIQTLWHSEVQGSAAVQTSIDAINGVISKHTADVSTGVTSILDAAKILGTNFPDSLKPVVEQLASLPGLTDAEKTSLLALTTAAGPSVTDLTNVATKYGLKLDDLGSKTAQLDISSRADQTLKDFNELTGAGADYGKTIDGFSKKVSSLVDDALTYGSSLPTALEPIAQAMINSGELTDATGGKIKDLSKLKFDDTQDPLAKGMASLADEIKTLNDLLANKLPKAAEDGADGVIEAINRIPSHKDVTVTAHYSQDGQPGGAGASDVTGGASTASYGAASLAAYGIGGAAESFSSVVPMPQASVGAPVVNITISINAGAVLGSDYGSQNQLATLIQKALLPHLSMITKWSL